MPEGADLEESDEAVKDGHTDAAVAVLKKRADVCREVIKQRIETKKHYDVSFFAGKREGYEQAIDLLKSSTESSRIELCHKKKKHGPTTRP